MKYATRTYVHHPAEAVKAFDEALRMMRRDAPKVMPIGMGYHAGRRAFEHYQQALANRMGISRPLVVPDNLTYAGIPVKVSDDVPRDAVVLIGKEQASYPNGWTHTYANGLGRVEAALGAKSLKPTLLDRLRQHYNAQ